MDTHSSGVLEVLHFATNAFNDPHRKPFDDTHRSGIEEDSKLEEDWKKHINKKKTAKILEGFSFHQMPP